MTEPINDASSVPSIPPPETIQSALELLKTLGEQHKQQQQVASVPSMDPKVPKIPRDGSQSPALVLENEKTPEATDSDSNENKEESGLVSDVQGQTQIDCDEDDEEEVLTSGGPILVTMDSKPLVNDIQLDSQESKSDPLVESASETLGFVIDTQPQSNNPSPVVPASHGNLDEEYNPEDPSIQNQYDEEVEESVIAEGSTSSIVSIQPDQIQQQEDLAQDSFIDSIIAEGMGATEDDDDPLSNEPAVSVSNVQPLSAQVPNSAVPNTPTITPDVSSNSLAQGYDPLAFHPTHTVHFTTTPSILAKIPDGSRLFIGHILTSKTSKNELASIFAQYGNIVEISLREHYAFVQFDNSDSCQAAIDNENRRNIGGSLIDLKKAKETRFSARLKRDETLQHSERPLNENDRVARPAKDAFGRDERHRPYDRPERQDRRGPPPSGRSSGRYDDRFDSRRYDDRGGRRDGGYARDDRYSETRYDRPPPPGVPTGGPPDCHIVIIDTVPPGFQSFVTKILQRYDITVDVTHGVSGPNLANVVSSIVARGTFGIVFMERKFERDAVMSLHVYPVGSYSPKEYTRVEADEVGKILFKEKQSRLSTRPAGSYSQPPPPQWQPQGMPPASTTLPPYMQPPMYNQQGRPPVSMGYGGQSAPAPAYPQQPIPQSYQMNAPPQQTQPGLDNLTLLLNQIQQQNPGASNVAASLNPQLLMALGQAAAAVQQPPSAVQPLSYGNQPQQSMGYPQGPTYLPQPQQQQQQPAPNVAQLLSQLNAGGLGGAFGNNGGYYQQGQK